MHSDTETFYLKKAIRNQGHGNLFYGLFPQTYLVNLQSHNLFCWIQSFHYVQPSPTSSLFPLSALSA